MSLTLVLLLSVHGHAEIAHGATVNADNTGCVCEENLIKCEDQIPYTVPENVTDVVLSNVPLEELIPDKFCQLQWNSVTTLIITSVKELFHEFYELSNGVFDCLEQIKIFKFRSEFIKRISKFTLSGLSNITVLDLTGCRHLKWKYIREALSISTNFPLLTDLILSRVGIFSDILIFDQEFVNFLSFRPLAYLDLSYTDIALDFNSSETLCETLTFFSIAGAQTQYSRTFNNTEPCKSLQIFDNSHDMHLRNDFKDAKCLNEILVLELKLQFFASIRSVLNNYIVTENEHFVMANCTWDVYPHNAFLNEFHFSSNYLPNFDSVIIKDGLESVDLSNNEIQTINPGAFEQLKSLSHLDLSNNSLYKTVDFENTFVHLLSRNIFLKELDLAGNRLSFVPNQMFASNVNLQELHLSRNNFHQITFNISHLLRLRLLDLRFNAFESLDDKSRNALDNLYDKQKRLSHATQNIRIHVLLQGNRFWCDCASLDFLKWFAVSKVFSDSRNSYFCQTGESSVPMNKSAIEASKQDCIRIKRRRQVLLLGTIGPSAFSLIMIVILIIVYKRRKKRLQQKRFRSGIQRLRENKDLFPVFLSYSSDDSEFVKRHMLGQMQV